MTLIYKTREGEVWTVKDCRPHHEALDFFVGTRASDGRQVTVHRHRVTQVPEQEDKQPKETDHV